ncbi:ABC transporter permease [Denitrobaculum tricleocarpae]|uniref:ABC transporter permease n=1 Tax=Denitrobaculum tricleocarpae TaxID=2591009 RepID=A0A545TR18_9PROT|nr:ABC transporter permease [Denitrobaculum tricleocarpae]TQV79668.1 ABC transporter permease [Denitrobaculum tricleocarpae]
MDFSIITENISEYINGLWLTVQLVSLSLVIGLVLSVPFAVMRSTNRIFISGPVWLFTYCFRGTPLLVQMFLFYYGLGQLEFVKELSQSWTFMQDAYWYALLAFTLNTAAYTTEIIRGAIVATPYGEIEAARACGMSRSLVLRRVVLPSAFRRALPAYSNEVIFMLHGSALASLITLVDITGAARIINSRYYSPYEAFLTAAAFYMALTFLIVWGFRQLEKRWHAHLKPRETN